MTKRIPKPLMVCGMAKRIPKTFMVCGMAKRIPKPLMLCGMAKRIRWPRPALITSLVLAMAKARGKNEYNSKWKEVLENGQAVP